MTINASTYFRPCDCEGGVIDTDITIYLAPETSIDGLIPVGSDTTGDGSYDAPFFSIKRAMEYLENYRIKIGKYVLIRGLPGMYYYDENHAVEIKHKDAKYIKIHFDMLETINGVDYFHETIVDTSTVTVTNNTDHDLVEFGVYDIGSGSYQLQAGDYIKIRPENDLLENPVYAVWAGYYRVHSVDTTNKKVTIVFKREQVSGSYNSGHSYGFPSTMPSGIVINVMKLSTHQYINCTTCPPNFFKSEFGFGSIKANASDEHYYSTNGVSGSHSLNYFYIYDGVINEITLHLNGFSIGAGFENLQCNFDNNSSKLYSYVTSCAHGFELLQSNMALNGFVGNNCVYPCTTGSGCTLTHIHTTIKMVVCNSYWHGLAISGSSFKGASNPITSKTINSFYNSTGIVVWNNSTYGGLGVNSQYNGIGVGISDSSVLFFINYDNNNVHATIHNNITGIKLDRTSTCDISYTDIRNNTSYGVYGVDKSSIITTTAYGYDTSKIYDNNDKNIVLINDCSLSTNNVSVSGGNFGLWADRGCNIILLYNTLRSNTDGSNSGAGINLSRNCVCSLSNCDIVYNDYGIRSFYNCGFEIESCSITGNSQQNINISYDCHVVARMASANALSGVSPAKNTAPSYNNGTEGSYIIEQTY